MKPITIVTANVDFALGTHAVDLDLAKIILNADALTFQEAKNVDVNGLIQNPKWRVFQDLRDTDKQGTGIAWRRPPLHAIKRGRRIGVTPHGKGLLTRWITWVDFVVRDETGEEHTFRLASVHLPPKRYWALYPFMVANIIAFVKSSRYPVILGGDWNKLVRHANDLHALARRVGGKFYGYGIDGFLVIDKGQILVKGTKQLAETHSDHRPVLMEIVIV
jgi:hypothetical protein